MSLFRSPFRYLFCLIPTIVNNFGFERVKAPKIDDRKRHCIELILCRLRSSICRQLSRSSNSKLFTIVGITLLITAHAPDIQAVRRQSDPPPPPPPPKHATQAGDWFTRLRALYFLPHNSSSSFQTAPYAGTGVDVRPFWLGEFDFGCMFTKQFGFEISLSTSETTLRATRALYDQKIGSTWVFPPILTLQWRFAPTYLIQPYIGTGANYTLFYSKSCSLPSSNLNLSHSWGPVAQAGIDLFFSENHSWLFNFDVKYVWSKTKVSLKSNLTETVKNTAYVDINPWVFGCGIGRKW